MRQRDEAFRLEQEKMKLRQERERLERDRLETERLLLERERLERQRIEQLRQEQCRLQEQVRAAKRPFEKFASRHDDDYWSGPIKRPTSDRHDNYGGSRRDSRFDNGDRKVGRYDRRDNRNTDTRGSNRGHIEDRNERREERRGDSFTDNQRNTRDDRRNTRTLNRSQENRRDLNRSRDDDRRNNRSPQRQGSRIDWKSDRDTRMVVASGRDVWLGQSSSGVQDDRRAKHYDDGSGIMSNGANSSQRESWGNNSDRSKMDPSWGHGVVSNSGARGGGSGDRWMGGMQDTHSNRGGGFNLEGSGNMINTIGGTGLYMASTPQNTNLMMMGGITRQPEARYLQQATVRRF
ncbi:SAFB-like transcription modulator [Haliotis rubra]|uniref:SAFB-like transcription modulator n=1 Tax=Haliotis rubra TaxID=36100 RepID=UPI001EE5DFB0|nr:SAFB-like transcription modulator [Haliotis rubra]